MKVLKLAHRCRQLLHVALLAATTLGGGCAALSPVPPFHLIETAEVLRRGAVSVTAAGGGGSALLDGSGGGGGLRLRVGVARRDEVGLEGTALIVNTGTPDPTRRWLGTTAAFGYKLSWKHAATPWAALIAGLGGSHSATGEALGGDLGVVFSRSRGLWRPYGGMRGTFAVPVGRPLDGAGGVTFGFVVPGGLALALEEQVRLFVEAGFSSLWSTGQPKPDLSPEVRNHAGGYGAVGLSIAFGG